MKVTLKTSMIALALVAVLAPAIPARAESVPAAAAQRPLMQQPGQWVQDYTGRKADPAVVFGTMPNGMRYAILRNTTPSDGVAMRLRIGSGSIEESDEQQGLAHFLEHMAFRGSKNLADGEVVRRLERLGLKFGPDTNASTGQDQTLYMFNFPKADDASLDTGFTLLREIADRLTLAPDLVEAEKGVILSEERVRDVPQYRMAKASLGNSLAGTRAIKRWPIGTAETIKAATPERLRAYYEAHYRPDNATLIVVGNIDPARIESEIKARFGDWQSAGKTRFSDRGVPQPAARVTEFVAEGAPDVLSLTWVRPIDRRAATEAREAEDIVTLLALQVFNARLGERAAKPGSPFIGGGAAALSDVADSAGLTELSIAAAPEKWREALDAIVEEQRQALAAPISPDELDRAKNTLLAQYQAAADGAGTRTSQRLAGGLVASVNRDTLFTSPAQDLALAQTTFAKSTPQSVATALRRAFSGQGPILFRSAQAHPVGVQALEQQLQASLAKPLAARATETRVEWPYRDFGAPGPVAERRVDTALGTTFATFANGTRVAIKPTALEKDRIYISVALGNGRAGASSELVRALWATDLMPLGGTGKLPLSDIQRWTQTGGKLVSASLTTGDRAFSLSGATRPADFTDQMQLLAAYVRDPGFRPELADKLVAVGPMVSGQVDANAGAVFWREASRIFSGGTMRYNQTPATADIAATRADDLPALLKPALAEAPDLAIVGDVDVETALRVVGTTFGAGPARPRPAEIKVALTMPTGRAEPYEVRHGGRTDQAVYGAFWALSDYASDPRQSYVAEIAAAVLEMRMIETVREKLGMTYSPDAGAVTSIVLPGQGYFQVTLETPAENFGTFRDLLNNQLADLAAKPVAADELERARKPLIESRLKSEERNGWWLSNLSDMWRAPLTRDWLLGEVAGYKAVSPADLQAFAAQRLKGQQPTIIISRAK